MRFLFTLILLSSYSLPVLLGHGGVHALFGVEHHCCHNTAHAESHNHDAHGHTCQHHHDTESNPASNQGSAPSNQDQHSDENCVLCQHIAQAQDETEPVTVINLTESITICVIPSRPVIDSLCFSPCAPRGPPVA